MSRNRPGLTVRYFLRLELLRAGASSRMGGSATARLPPGRLAKSPLWGEAQPRAGESVWEALGRRLTAGAGSGGG